MIQGKVLASGEATVKLKMRGPAGQANVEAMIDTGFNDEMTLPAWAIQNLGLQFVHASEYTLADGIKSAARVFEGQIEWHGQWREIYIVEIEGDPLLGMGGLKGCHLGMDVVSGGTVEIRPLPVRDVRNPN